ncbi:hypothetical protein [Clostridioides difficile]|uniref:hypothetical protein n=1 Tax=Clostridioides difficile TaxID=1496 RepID=UPI000D1EC45E|nr:hypothetical protein [Clostridioides difficile]HBE9444498.1 hypothetical protein [Clostridioides difficile]
MKNIDIDNIVKTNDIKKLTSEIDKLIKDIKLESGEECTYIEIESIVCSEYKKVSIEDSLNKFSIRIENVSSVNPILVLYLEKSEQYFLLDGLIRVYISLKLHKKLIPAIVIKLNNIDTMRIIEASNIISAVINIERKYTVKELWNQIKLLEEDYIISHKLIESIYNMSPGDLIKLKDIMYSDKIYQDIRNNVVNGNLTINKAYEKLIIRRKNK